MLPTTIDSDAIIADIGQHFRVSAGPGAGKTHWLMSHIRHVIVTSESLGSSQRIACISYTNVAAGKIVEGLGRMAWRVDASTIHSFLYRNLVRPYLWMLQTDEGRPLVNFAKVDGHKEHQPIRSLVEAWLKDVSNRGAYLVNELLNNNGQATLNYLRGIRWQYNPTESKWKVLPPRMKPPNMLPITKLETYKRRYWDEGIIDHDDVLYFSHRLLDDNPSLRTFLAARFPYVFVDEFQDTNPVQVELIKGLASGGSVVGVVGDPEQSIFSFQGASRDGFVTFSLKEHANYRIADNRRSSNQIVALLNQVRCDKMEQKAVRLQDGPDVELLVGNPSKAVEHMEDLAGNTLVVLARCNAEVAVLRTGGVTANVDPWVKFREVDSGSGRVEFWERLLAACELARSKRFGESVGTLGDAICGRSGSVRKPFKCADLLSPAQRDGVAVALIESILCDYKALLDSALVRVYGLVAEAAEKALPGLTMQRYATGKPKAFADSIPMRALVAAVSVEEDTRRIRTIHKAKSAEFENVLVCLGEEERLDHILSPDPSQDEEQRITYVALSRARTRLAITVPSLSVAREATITALGIRTIRLTDAQIA